MVCGVLGFIVQIYFFKVLAMICGLLQVGEFIFYAWLFARVPILEHYNKGLLVFLEIIFVLYMIKGLSLAVGVWTQYRSKVIATSCIFIIIQIILLFACIPTFYNNRYDFCSPFGFFRANQCWYMDDLFSLIPCLIAVVKISHLLILYIAHFHAIQAIAEGISAVGRALG